MYSIKEVYNRVSVKNDTVLTLVEMWDGGTTEAHLCICKEGNDFILCEMIHHFYSKNESEFRHKLTNTSNLQNIAREIEDFCKCRYNGTLNLDFEEMLNNTEVLTFFGY